MYLTLRFVDHTEVNVTCCVNGFFKGNTFSSTLVGLLYQVNNNFTRNLEQHLNNILNAEPYFLTNLQVPVYRWLSEKEQKIDMQSLGADPNSIREWNEEFQVCKDLPKDTLY